MTPPLDVASSHDWDPTPGCGLRSGRGEGRASWLVVVVSVWKDPGNKWVPLRKIETIEIDKQRSTFQQIWYLIRVTCLERWNQNFHLNFRKNIPDSIDSMGLEWCRRWDRICSSCLPAYVLGKWIQSGCDLLKQGSNKNGLKIFQTRCLISYQRSI